MFGLTTFGTAVVAGAGHELGRYAMKHVTEHPDKVKEVIEKCDKAVEAGWEKDREAGGISSCWDKESKTATA